MEIQQDFKELLELFNVHQVEYLIVGGYALAFHGAPRFTGDIDILVKPGTENSLKIINALEEFGFGSIWYRSRRFQRDVIEASKKKRQSSSISGPNGVRPARC